MKVKILSLLLSVTLLFFAVTPASASESSYINVLDFALPNGEESFNVTVSPDDNIVSFDMATLVAYRDIDITAYVSLTGLSGVTFISAGGVRTPLTMTRMASGVYKIQGEFTSSFGGSFKLEFDVSRSLTIGFISVKVNTINSSVFDETGSCKISSLLYQDTINYNSADTVNGRTFNGTNNYEYNYLILDAKVDDWKLYDRLDLVLYVKCSDINSISCFIGNQVIENVTVGLVSEPNWVINNYYISVSIDLSEINKKGNDFVPTVHIEASVAPDLDNIVQVISMSGYLDGSSVNPVVFWLQKTYIQLDTHAQVTWRWLSQIFDSLSGNTDPGNSFQDDVQQEIDQLDQAVDVMDSVSRPDINSIDVSMNQFVSGADLAVLTAPVGVFFELDLFKSILIMSILLATVSFVLFGKR